MLYRGSDLFGFLGAKLGNGGSTFTADYPIVLADCGLLLVHDASDNTQRTATIPACQGRPGPASPAQADVTSGGVTG